MFRVLKARVRARARDRERKRARERERLIESERERERLRADLRVKAIINSLLREIESERERERLRAKAIINSLKRELRERARERERERIDDCFYSQIINWESFGCHESCEWCAVTHVACVWHIVSAHVSGMGHASFMGTMQCTLLRTWREWSWFVCLIMSHVRWIADMKAEVHWSALHCVREENDHGSYVSLWVMCDESQTWKQNFIEVHFIAYVKRIFMVRTSHYESCAMNRRHESRSSLKCTSLRMWREWSWFVRLIMSHVLWIADMKAEVHWSALHCVREESLADILAKRALMYFLRISRGNVKLAQSKRGTVNPEVVGFDSGKN